MKKAFITLIAIISLAGCFPFDEGKEEKIVGRYYVRGDYRLANVHIGYRDGEYGGIGLISEPITAVGHNENYIIAKRGTDDATYYILKVVKNGVHIDAEKAMIGPLNKNNFDKELKQLGLDSSLQFDKEYGLE